MPPPHSSKQVMGSAVGNGRGRPLRFLALVLCLWAGGRLLALHGLPTGGPDGRPRSPSPMARAAPPGSANPIATRQAADIAPETPRLPSRPSTPGIETGFSAASPPRRQNHPFAPEPSPAASPANGAAALTPGPIAEGSATLQGHPSPPPSGAVPLSSGAAIAPPRRPPHKWTHAAWLFWRDKASPAAIGNGGQLGGAQIGFRTDRYLGDAGGPLPISLYGRLSAALREPAAPEAAFGIAAHPLSGRVPVVIGLERRIPLDNDARGAFAFIAATGLNPTPIGRGINAEGYAQSGMVGFSHTDLFADGRLSLTAALDGDERSGAGFSLSGGAQPGVARLDIGPVLHHRLPWGSARPRLSVEWKQRIAGRAAPGSGPAITLAGDF